MSSVGAEPYWVVLRDCPTRNEKVCGTLDEDQDVNIQFFDGTAWGNATEITSDADTNSERAFDLAYESQSGDLLVAYWQDEGSNSNKVGYRTYNGSVLSNEAALTLPANASVRFLTLYAHPNSDAILLLALNASNNLFAAIWSGTAWGSVTELESNTETSTEECYSAAFECQSGDLLVVYIESGADNPRYRWWTGSGWSSEAQMPNIGGDGRWVRLAASPLTDDIIFGALDERDDVNVCVWNGSTWGSSLEVTSNTREYVRRQFDVAYESGSNAGMVAYHDSFSRQPRYRTWNGSSWGSEQRAAAADSYDRLPALSQGRTDGELFLTCRDYRYDLYAYRWSDNAMSGITKLESNLGGTHDTESYMVSAPLAVARPAADTPYFTDFESAVGAEWSNTATDTTVDLTTFLGRFSTGSVDVAFNTTVGESYTLEFDFYAIDSWNGNSDGDVLAVAINGADSFSESFSQRSAYPASFPNPADRQGNFGFNNSHEDGVYRITVSFTATTSVTTVAFTGELNSDMDDESWGIDNVSVDLARFVDVSTAWNFNQSTSTDSTYASGLHFFDADDDGDIDAIIGGNQAKRMLNDGTWFVASSFGTGNERRQHAIFDVDNDGDIDFWSGNHSSYNNEACFENNGSGIFNDLGHLGFSDPNNNEGVAAADVNRDGWCDIVHFCENDNWIGHHQGDPGASLPSLIGTNNNSYGLSDSGDIGDGDYVSAGDVNNDGHLDFFYHYAGGKLFVSDGDGTYTERTDDIGPKVYTGQDDKFGSAWADYDNDGDLDLFCARRDANNRGYLWRNDVSWTKGVSGTFSELAESAAINDESGQFGCAWGDYDNDGDLDLYVATRSGPNKLYQNQGNGTFRMMDEGAGVTGNCQDVVLVDFDNDGDLDIAVTREDDDAVLLENRTNNDNYLKVRVVGAGGGGTNTAGIGVRVELWSDGGKAFLGRRDLGVARGLGTEPLWAHFGGVDPTATYQIRTYLHSRDNGDPLVTTVVPQSVSTTIGGTTIPQMITITEENAKKRIKSWREVRNRS